MFADEAFMSRGMRETSVILRVASMNGIEIQVDDFWVCAIDRRKCSMSSVVALLILSSHEHYLSRWRRRII